MNGQEAKKNMEVGKEFKFVATLVPPMLALAQMEKDFSHSQMGYKFGLVERTGDRHKPFKPKNPPNFKACRLKLDETQNVHFTALSTDFPENSITDADLQALFQVADITIL